MPSKEVFAAINATLNGTATLLLLVGLILIKRKQYRQHAIAMVSACVVSAAFLITYLSSKAIHGERSSGLPPGWLKTLYLIILIPHLIAAIVMLPPILVLLYRAYKRQWDKHSRLAPYVWAIWFYVSVTGVVIYFMLYHLFPALYPPKTV